MRSMRRIATFLVLVALASSAMAAAPRKILPFIQEDYATALAEARAKNLPVFVEAWAPW